MLEWVESNCVHGTQSYYSNMKAAGNLTNLQDGLPGGIRIGDAD